MVKSFSQILNEALAPKKAKKVAKKVVKKAKKENLKEAWLAPIGYTDRGKKKKEYDFELTAEDIGLTGFKIVENYDFGDDSGTDSYGQDKRDAVGHEDSESPETSGTEEGEGLGVGESNGSSKPAYKTVTLTVPALMKVLRAVSKKSPDNIVLNSMVLSMAHFCEGDCAIDAKDLEEIKHRMHGMEYSKGSKAEPQDDMPEEEDDTLPDPSVYATDDVVDDAEEAKKANSPVSAEEENQEIEMSNDDSEGTSDESEGDEAGDDESEDGETDTEENFGTDGEDEGSDSEESEEEGEDESDEDEKVKEGRDRYGMDDEIDMLYEGLTEKDITTMKRRMNLNEWWKK